MKNNFPRTRDRLEIEVNGEVYTEAASYFTKSDAEKCVKTNTGPKLIGKLIVKPVYVVFFHQTKTRRGNELKQKK